MSSAASNISINNAEVLEKVRHLRQYGKLSDALNLLQTLPPACVLVPPFAIETAHILIEQGYYNRAADFLDLVLQTKEETHDDEALLVLRLQSALASVEMQGKFDDAKVLMTQVSEKFLTDGDNDPSASKVWIVIYYAHNVQIRYKYQEDGDLDILRTVNERLAAFQEQLERAGRVDEAFDVLLSRLFALEAKERKTAVQRFYSFDDPKAQTDRIQGTCHLELARAGHALNNEDIAKAELELAKVSYSACSHSLGLADVALESALVGSLNENYLTSLTECVQLYRRLDNPARELTTHSHISRYLREKEHYSAFYSVQKTILNLANRTSAKLVWCFTQLSTIGSASLQSGHLGAHLETCNALVDTLHSMQALYLAERCATSLYSAYLGLDDTEKCIKFAQKAFDISIERRDRAIASEHVEELATAKQLHAKRFSSIKEFEEACALLSGWAETDAKDGRIEGEFNKYSFLITLEEDRRKVIGEERSCENALGWLARAKALIPSLPDQKRETSLAEITFKESKIWRILGNEKAVYDCLHRAADIFQNKGKVREVVEMWLEMGRSRLRLVGTTPSVTENVALLNQALVHLRSAQEQLEISNSKQKLAKCHLLQARLWQFADLYGHKGGLNEALRDLERAESIRNEMREECSTLPTEQAIIHKQSLVSQGYEIYSLALEICVEMDDAAAAWQWVQRGKARSLSDLLGLGVVLPSEVAEQAERDPKAKQWLQEEESLVKMLADCPEEGRFQLRTDLLSLREKMGEIPILRTIFELRNGKMETSESLSDAFGGRTEILCVDWATYGNTILMFTVRPAEAPEMHKIKLTSDYVAKWKRNFLTTENLRDDKAIEWLKDLEGLVSPLGQVCKDNDLIILSPSGNLNGLPLHALCVSGKPIIERYRVVYASSLSILRHCVSRRPTTAPSHRGTAVFGDPSSNRREAALSSGRLADRLETKPFLGHEATLSAFRQSAGADIIHYHGHAKYSSVDPLESGLILADGTLTARELFSIPFQVAFITLIACESAAQDIGVGDEPTGLLPSLLYSGASAVIGTLWPLWDIVGGIFAETFYESFAKEARESQGPESVVDLAEALRKAVLQIREERPAPYFWALFVLHGNWLYQSIK